MATITAEPAKRTSDDRQIAEKKRLALAYLTEAWEGARAEGVDSEILAHAALARGLVVWSARHVQRSEGGKG